MAGTTPNLGLYLPGGGSSGTYTPDEVADIDPLNSNFVKLDTFAGTVGVQTNQNKQFYGPAAAIAAITGQKLGDEYQESDAGKLRWRYDGANWVLNVGGMQLVRPTSVTGCQILPDGSIGVSGSNTNWVINGCFSTRYRKYRIDYHLRLASAGNLLTQLAKAGVPDATLAYAWQSIEGSATSITATLAVNDFWPTSRSSAANHWGWFNLDSPMNSGAESDTTVYEGQFSDENANSHSLVFRSGLFRGSNVKTNDGIRLFTQGAGAILDSSYVRIYGMV